MELYTVKIIQKTSSRQLGFYSAISSKLALLLETLMLLVIVMATESQHICWINHRQELVLLLRQVMKNRMRFLRISTQMTKKKSKKIIPSWASRNCVALALSSKKQIDPCGIFPRESFCSMDKVLLPQHLT